MEDFGSFRITKASLLDLLGVLSYKSYGLWTDGQMDIWTSRAAVAAENFLSIFFFSTSALLNGKCHLDAETILLNGIFDEVPSVLPFTLYFL